MTRIGEPWQRCPRLTPLVRERLKEARAEKPPQPTADGYWWTRPASDCLWRVVYITIVSGKPWIQEMGEEGQDLLPACPWWEWVGPIAPP